MSVRFPNPGPLAAASFIVLAGCAGSGMTPAPAPYSARVQLPQSAPSSPIHAYYIGDGSNDSFYLSDLRTGADGRLYFALNGLNLSPTNGEIGWFDPRSHTQRFVYTNVYEPAFIQESGDGSVWVSEFNNASGQPTIDRYAGIGGKVTPIAIPVGPFNGGPYNGLNAEMAVAPDGAVWFGSDQSSQIGTIDPSTNAVTVYNISAPNEPWGAVPQYMTMGSDGALWVSDFFNDGVYRVATAGPSKGTSTFSQLPQGPWSSTKAEYALGLREGGDGKLYVAGNGQNGGFVDRAPVSANPSFKPMPRPALDPQSSLIAAGGGKVYFNDNHYSSLGVYDVASKRTVFLPLEGAIDSLPIQYGGPVAVDASGTPYVGCIANGSTCIESITLTATWNVFPGTSVVFPGKDPYGNPLPSGMIGIGETGNSGPFSVAAKGNCDAAIIKGFDHDIQVNPLAIGKCTLAITDAHARTVHVSIDIVNGSFQPPAYVPKPKS